MKTIFALVVFLIPIEIAAQSHKAEQSRITNSIGMQLRQIPAGKFLMGSPIGESERDEGEAQRMVEVSDSFFIGVFEVTQGQYKAIMNQNPSRFSPTSDMEDGRRLVKGFDTSQFPVDSVSWFDATKFCKLLSAKPAEASQGRSYVLPTEIQWEYACRAGTSSAFSFGGVSNGGFANVQGREPYLAEPGFYLMRTTRVGEYMANDFGLFDMHGNVFEWCQDRFPSGDNDPLRVLRGGAWFLSPAYARSAYRYSGTPSIRMPLIGFRVVMLTRQ